MGGGSSRTAPAAADDSDGIEDDSFPVQRDYFKDLLEQAFTPFRTPPMAGAAAVIGRHGHKSQLASAFEMASRAESFRKVSKYEDAISLVRAAVLLVDAAHVAQPSAILLLAKVAVHCCMGHVLVELGHADEANEVYIKVEDLSEAGFALHHSAHLRAKFARAEIMQRRGDTLEAIRVYERIIKIEEEGLGMASPSSVASLALALEQTGALEQAMKHFQNALALKEAMYGGDDIRVAATLKNMAVVLDKQGKPEAAQTRLQRALSIETNTHGKVHVAIGQTLNNMGLLLMRQGKLIEASSTFEQSVTILEKKDAKHPALATALNNFGMCLLKEGEGTKGLAKLRESLALKEAHYAATPEHPCLADGLTNIGIALLKLKKPEEATLMLTRAAEMEENYQATKKTLPCARKIALLGNALMQQDGRLDDAIEKLEEAVDIYEDLLGEESEDAANVLTLLAEVLVDEPTATHAAKANASKALSIFEAKQTGDRDHPQVKHLQKLLKTCDKMIQAQEAMRINRASIESLQSARSLESSPSDTRPAVSTRRGSSMAGSMLSKISPDSIRRRFSVPRDEEEGRKQKIAAPDESFTK